MKFLANKKLASRIGIVMTGITLVGMLLLWLIVSSNVAAIVKNDITNQMTDAVESRAASELTSMWRPQRIMCPPSPWVTRSASCFVPRRTPGR